MSEGVAGEASWCRNLNGCWCRTVGAGVAAGAAGGATQTVAVVAGRAKRGASGVSGGSGVSWLASCLLILNFLILNSTPYLTFSP
jgi:hypothetical protein